MLKYKCKKIDEEIARWTAEVFFKCKDELGWWIAFTNPTAGPWKKLLSKKSDGKHEEAYRFDREEKRPDVVLVNDKLKKVIIVEAKDSCPKLVKGDQMPKSLEVVKDMTEILQKKQGNSWDNRTDYEFVSSFLWYTDSLEKVKEDNQIVVNSFNKHISNGVSPVLLNIVIIPEGDDLVPKFIFKGTVYEEPVFNSF